MVQKQGTDGAMFNDYNDYIDKPSQIYHHP